MYLMTQNNILPKAEVFYEALYTIDIGQDDSAAGYFLNMTTSEVKYVEKNIDGQEGRYFWIHNTTRVPWVVYHTFWNACRTQPHRLTRPDVLLLIVKSPNYASNTGQFKLLVQKQSQKIYN
ncbi:hypothetical protein PanWU01x14_125760 [Parasponia andersonii]|uniref:Uncharacterized protein n=1 Tax=Parasponia andersonii TaxID=3476 RepID=A0A2P5CT99_PARAD|nr:hypothetical protein PanWU01x14_125760 [Parasponia andersonii]